MLEGEQLLLKKTNPITEKYQTFIDTINGGGFLGPKQKQMLLQETKILMDTSFNDFLDQRQNYVDIGIDNFGDKFNAETQLPMPSLDVYQNDVTSGIIEKLILGDGVDTTVNGKTYKFPRFLSGGLIMDINKLLSYEYFGLLTDDETEGVNALRDANKLPQPYAFGQEKDPQENLNVFKELINSSAVGDLQLNLTDEEYADLFSSTQKLNQWFEKPENRAMVGATVGGIVLPYSFTRSRSRNIAC